MHCVQAMRPNKYINNNYNYNYNNNSNKLHIVYFKISAQVRWWSHEISTVDGRNVP